MSEIRSQPPRDLPGILGESSGPRVLLNIQVIDLPLRHSLDEAWSNVNEQVVPELARAVWHANGLRVGVLDLGHWDAFTDKLPAPLSARESQLATTTHPVAICRSPLLPGILTVDRTIPPMAVREQRVRGGRMQLLARVIPGPAGATRLELLPHHFKPNPMITGQIVHRADRVRFEPRTAQEKELDGTIFDDLALQFEMVSGRTLIVGLYWPWDQPAIHNFADQLDDQRESDAEPPQTSNSEPPPLLNHVGRLLFAAKLPGAFVQKIMVVSVDRRSAPVPVSRGRP